MNQSNEQTNKQTNKWVWLQGEKTKTIINPSILGYTKHTNRYRFAICSAILDVIKTLIILNFLIKLFSIDYIVLVVIELQISFFSVFLFLDYSIVFFQFNSTKIDGVIYFFLLNSAILFSFYNSIECRWTSNQNYRIIYFCNVNNEYFHFYCYILEKNVSHV